MFEIYSCKSPKNSGYPNVKKSGKNIIHFLCGILDNVLIWFFLSLSLFSDSGFDI